MNRRNFLKTLGVTAITVPFLSLNLDSKTLEPLSEKPKTSIEVIGKCHDKGAVMCLFNSDTKEIYYNGDYKEGIISLDDLPVGTNVTLHVRNIDYVPFAFYSSTSSLLNTKIVIPFQLDRNYL